MTEPALNYSPDRQRFIIGIDPGISGAIAVLDSSGDLIAHTAMPVYQPAKASRVNAAALSAFLEPYTNSHAILEQVGAMPGQGVASMFSFGHSAGVIEGVLAALCISYELVTPQTWKKHFKLNGKPKDAGRALAQRFYPSAPLGRKKDGGLADALLLARQAILACNKI